MTVFLATPHLLHTHKQSVLTIAQIFANQNKALHEINKSMNNKIEKQTAKMLTKEK